MQKKIIFIVILNGERKNAKKLNVYIIFGQMQKML